MIAPGLIALGLSSGSVPSASAAELAVETERGNGSTVDLRIGKGHAWENEGVGAGIAVLASHGVSVAFVGIGWHVGAADAAGEPVPSLGLPVKVFAVENPDFGLVAEQVAAAGAPLWIETHRGGPSPARLASLAAATGAGVLLDLLGLAETGGADDATLAELAPHVHAVQVKGVTAERRHRALRPDDLEPVRHLLALGAPIRAITVESRAGTHVDDLAVLGAELGLVTR